MAWESHNGGSQFRNVIGTVPAAAKSAAAVNGAAIDRIPPGGTKFDSAKFSVVGGAISGAPTGTTVTIQVQDSADGSTGWANLPAQPNGGPTSLAAAFTQPNTAGLAQDLNIDLSNAKRFIRVVETLAFVGGTTPTMLVNTVCSLTGPDRFPTTTP